MSSNQPSNYMGGCDYYTSTTVTPNDDSSGYTRTTTQTKIDCGNSNCPTSNASHGVKK